MGMNAKLVLLLALTSALIAIALGETAEDYEQSLTRKMDEINEKDHIPIYGDMVSLERVMEDNVEAGRGSPDPLVNRIEKFFRSHKLQIRLPNDGSSADLFGRALGWKRKDVELKGLVKGASEARTKLKKILMPIMIALALKKLIAIPLVVMLIGMIGISAIGGGVLSMMLSGAVALSSMNPPPVRTRVTYGVPRPAEIHHDHWHRSEEEINNPYWHRSQEDINNPYGAWMPEFAADQYPYQQGP